MAANGRRTGWYYGWNIVAICIVAEVSVSVLAVNAYSLFLPEWSRDLRTPISLLHLGLAISGLGCALLSPLAGIIADRYPARRLFMIGLCAAATLLIGVSFVTSYAAFLAIFATGNAIALIFTTSVPANAVVARWFVRHRGLALGLTALGLGIGGVLAPPLLTHLIPAYGWRAIWRGWGLIVLLIVIPATFLILRDRPGPRDDRRYLEGAGAMPAGHHGGGGTLGWRDILGRRTFWLLVLAYVPMLALYGGGGLNLAPLARSRGLGADVGGLFLAAYSLAQLIAFLGGGALSDRIGNRRPLAGLAFLSAFGGVLAAIGQDAVTIGIGAALIGCGGGFWPILASALAGEYGAANTGRAFGLLAVFTPLTGIFPALIAKLQEGSGSYAPALIALSALAAVGGIAALFIRDGGVPRSTPRG